MPALVAALAAAARVGPWLARYPLHRDEALYGAWARLIASGTDPLLLTAWVDKPPLVIYLLAGSLQAFGISEPALRLPGMLAGVLTGLLVYGLSQHAYNRQVALLASILFAISPFAILFAPTAFTDPWLTLWLVAAAWAALAGQPFWAGAALGLAVASKQQGVLVVPLVLALLALNETRNAKREAQICCAPVGGLRLSSFVVHRVLPALAGFLLVFAPLTYWDSLRWAKRPSFWDRSFTTYGGLALAPLVEWPGRLANWGRQLSYLFGLPALSGLMLALAALAGVSAARQLAGPWRPRRAAPTSCRNSATSRQRVPSVPTAFPFGCAQARRSAARRFALLTEVTSPLRATTQRVPVGATNESALDLVLGAYIVGYLGLHVMFTFQPWDRYLLPLVPLVAILTARGLIITWDWLGSVRWRTTPLGKATSALRATTQESLLQGSSILRVPAATGLALLLAWAMWLGLTGRLPVGSDHGAYEGLDRVAVLLRSQPSDTVIYHRSLGWYFDFYLFDAPQERRWWDTGWKLVDVAVDTARTDPSRHQLLVLTAWEDAATDQIPLALASWGLRLVERESIFRRDGSRAFQVYEIVSARG